MHNRRLPLFIPKLVIAKGGEVYSRLSSRRCVTNPRLSLFIRRNNIKRPIKFRGVDTEDGARDTVIFTLEDLLADSESYGLVDPNTVAQLVGYDSLGNEVYEGDIATDYAGHEYYAALWGNVTKDDTLKEAQS